MNINIKKITHLLSSILLYSILTIIGIIVIMFIAYFIDQKMAMQKGENRPPLFSAYVIISDSMVPNINVYDAVVTMRVSEKKIKVNDVITFISKDIETRGTPITHRVVGIEYDQNDSTKVLGYRTKGDHNNTQDFAIIKPDEVLGKVYLRIPFVGYLQKFLTKPIGWLLVIVIPCLLIIGSDVLKIGKKLENKNQEVNLDAQEKNNKIDSKVSQELPAHEEETELDNSVVINGQENTSRKKDYNKKNKDNKKN